MSTIKTQFDNLNLGDKLSSSRKAWAALKTQDISPKYLEDIERLIRVLNSINVQIINIDAELYPSSTWSKINAHVVSIQTHANNFKNSKNADYIHHANNEVDAILSIFRPTHLDQQPELSEFFAQSEKAFTQEVLELLVEVKSSRDNWNNQLKSFAQSLDEIKTRLAQADQTIQSQKQRLDTSITQFQNQFSEAQEARRNDFTGATRKNSEEFKDFMQTSKVTLDAESQRFATEHSNILRKTTEATEQSLKSALGIEGEIRRIFNVVGNVALTGNYSATADNERKAANIFRGISLGLMGLMAMIAGLIFYHSLSHPEVDWKLFGFRLGTTLIIALPALYAAQESAKHREREKLNRKLHLELSAIDAYLELLPVEEKYKIKGQLTEKFFGQNEPLLKEEQLTKHDLFDLFAQLLKAISKSK